MRWGGLRPEPYKLSPPDADSDMIVQEGTAWERPGGLRLLDRLGNAIEAGMESLSSVDGLRYVDADGNDVAYTPTWATEEIPVPGTGLRTLKNSGVRTVGEMTGGSASLKDRGLALGDRRKAVAEAIREAQKPKVPEPEPEPHPLLTGIAKAEKVKAELEAVGGHWSMTAKERKAFTDSEAKRSEGTAEKAALGRPWVASTKTTAELVTQSREKVLERLREQLDIQDDVLAGPHDQEIKDRHGKYKERLQKAIDYLESHTDEEFVAELAKALRIWYDDEDNDLCVAMPHGEVFDSFLEDGYKTTHEVTSQHSGEDIRGDYEVSQGVPRDAPESVRPASGFVHAGATKRYLAEEDEGFVHDPRRDHPDRDHTLTALNHQRSMHGKSVYGQIQLVLNEDVKERTKAGNGDTLNAGVVAAPMVGATDEELVESFLSSVSPQTAPLKKTTTDKVLDALELVIDGAGANNKNIGYRDQGIHETEMKLGGDLYVEALIFGSFDLDDVAEIKIPPTVWTTHALEHAPLRSMTPSYGRDDSPADQALMGVLQTGRDIEDLDPEIEASIRDALIETPEQVRDAIRNTRFAIVMDNLASMRKRAAMLAAVRAKNKEVKVTFLSELGVDMDDVSIFGAEGVGKTVEQVYQARLIEVLEKLAIEIKNWEPPAERVPIPMSQRL